MTYPGLESKTAGYVFHFIHAGRPCHRIPFLRRRALVQQFRLKMSARLSVIFRLLRKRSRPHAAPRHEDDAAAAQNDQEHDHSAHQQPDLGLRARRGAATAGPVFIVPIGIDAIRRTNPSAANRASHFSPRPFAGAYRNAMIALRTVDIVWHGVMVSIRSQESAVRDQGSEVRDQNPDTLFLNSDL